MNHPKSQTIIQADICVIGAGSGGLSVAAAAAQMGRQVVLIEKHKMGGDCLNYGCVPSKALIAAAHAAYAMRTSAAFGITPQEPQVSGPGLHKHIHEIIDKIAPDDSEERFTQLGCKVIRATARFVSPDMIEAGGQHIKARRFVIATGSSPAIPNLPGLDQVDFLTNESLFDLTEIPEHLLVLGAGPIGVEMAQAYARLGAKVSLIGRKPQILPREDAELAEIVAQSLKTDGVELYLNADAKAFGPGPEITLSDGRKISGSHILIATGRKACVDDLGLTAAGIAYDQTGIIVNAGLCTSNRRIFAIGDVIGGLQFTHVANYHAGLVIRRALFRLPAKENRQILPRVTFTDPELAQVGLTEAEARAKQVKFTIRSWPFAHNDRARAERQSQGMVKVLVGRGGRILGAGIAGPRAGDLIAPWVLAMSQGLKISALAGAVAAYPTLGEANRRAAMSHYAGLAQKPWLRKILRVLSWFG